MVYYIDNETEKDFAEARANPKGINNYFYKYVPYKEMLKEDSRNHLFFIRPELWNDPWESLVLTGNYQIDKNKYRKYPLYGKVLATCFTSNYGSEAQWKVYETKEAKIMLSVNKTKLIDALKTAEEDVFIGKVKYDTPQPQIHNAIKKWAKNHMEYFEDGADINSIEVRKKLLEPLLIKRKPFGYEQEYRFFIISDKVKDRENILIPNLSDAIGKVTLSPQKPKFLTEEEEQELWEEFKTKTLLELFQEKQKAELRKFGYNEFHASSLYVRKEDRTFDLTK